MRRTTGLRFRRSTMSTRTALVVMAALGFSSLGFAQKVRFDFDHGTDFAKFRTYRLVRTADNPTVNQLAGQRIVAALEEELAKKGLKKVDTGGDMLVGYQASVSRQTQYTTFNDGFGPG